MSAPHLRGQAAALLAIAVLATLLPSTSAYAERRVPQALFGQHVQNIADAPPATLERVGAIRLWDSGVAWRDVQPKPGRYVWSTLDAAVQNARKLGAEEVLYIMGATPAWAASVPNSSLAIHGPGSNSHPKRNSYYLKYLRAVASRYKGQITSYQVWNEANLKDFYLGTPRKLARLTKQARAALREVDPRAKLVAASTTVRSGGPVGKFGSAYGAAMKRVGWPVDAVSAHLYPPATAGPGTRVAYIKVIKAYYAKHGAGGKPLWDTELNYGDRRARMPIKRVITGAAAARYVARTYLDSMRFGVSRVFWFGWDMHILGTDMTSTNSGRITAGGRAFIELQDWLVGKRWLGCSTNGGGVTVCWLATSKGSSSSVRYASRKQRVQIPRGVTSIHRLDGSKVAVTPGQTVKLTRQPVLFKG